MRELLYLKDEQIKDFIEKLFLSYRDTFSDSKSVLNKYSLDYLLYYMLSSWDQWPQGFHPHKEFTITKCVEHI